MAKIAAGLKCRADTDYFVADNSTIGRGSNTTLIELIFPFATNHPDANKVADSILKSKKTQTSSPSTKTF